MTSNTGSPTLVTLENVGLTYRPLRIDRSIFRPSTLRHARHGIHALQDITMNLRRGDRIGVIGANGAGKTTLLRVAAGIFSPTTGIARVSPDTQSLIDAGFGLSPLLSGRENARTLGILRGLQGDALERYIVDVGVDSGLGDFFDRAVSTYSTGMSTRVIFSICTLVPPKVLILDELLSAGDASFMEKARLRFRRFMSEASAILLASHSLGTVIDVCESAIWLEGGRIVEFGDASQVCANYNRRATNISS